jgi:hypothetical protein
MPGANCQRRWCGDKMAKAAARATFADEVDKLVHDALNNGVSVDSVPRAMKDARQLASAFLLLHELLQQHRQDLTLDTNSDWQIAGSLLDDLKTGLHGPIWRYIEDVRKTRRKAHQAAAGHHKEAIQGMVIGLIDAYRARTSRIRAAHLVIDAFAKQGWEINRHEINNWRRRFEKMSDDEHGKAWPKVFQANAEKMWPTPEKMLAESVKRILAMKRK